MENIIWALIIGYGALQGLFISITLLILKRGNTRANKMMSLFLLVLSLILAEVIIKLTNTYDLFPHYFAVSSPLWFLIGPIFYFYIRISLNKNFKFSWVDLVHLLPFLIILYRVGPVYFVPLEHKINIINNFLARTVKTPDYYIVSFINVSIFIAYLVFSIKNVIKYKKLSKDIVSNTEIVTLDWIKKAIIGILIYVIVDTSAAIYFLIFRVNEETSVHLSIATLTAFVHFFGFYAITRNESLFPIEINNKPKYEKSNLGEIEIAELKTRLLDLMDNEKPYINNNLNLSDLSDLLDTNKNNISQVLNVELNTNFYDFVNDYRIKDIKEKLLNPKYENYTILALALEVGFSNKSSFNRIFKKHTSQTPSEYIRQISLKKSA